MSKDRTVKTLISVDYGWKNCAHCLLTWDSDAKKIYINTYPVYSICCGVSPSETMHNAALSGALAGSYFGNNPLPKADSLVVEAPPEIKGRSSRGACGLIGAISAVFMDRHGDGEFAFVHKECSRVAVMAFFRMPKGGHEANKQASIDKVAELGLKNEHTDSDHVCDAILQGLFTWRAYWGPGSSTVFEMAHS